MAEIQFFFVTLQKKRYANTFLLYGAEFYFYSSDHSPIHVHVKIEKSEARYQVYPEMKLIENKGLKSRELRLAEIAIEENKEVIIARWKEHFKDEANGNNLQNLV